MPTCAHPSSDGPLKKWQVWSYDSDLSEALFATADTLSECVQIVQDDVNQLSESDEDLVPWSEYHTDLDSPNVRFPIPLEDTIENRIPVASGSNGPDIKFGWIIYRTGFEPTD